MEFFYGLNGIDLTEPFIALSLSPDAATGIDNNVTFLRPSGVDASYTPYLSTDLKNWSLAPMVIQDVVTELGTGLDRVTFTSIFPAQESALFFRIQPNFNPENFENGLLPNALDSRLMSGAASLRNAEETLGISYRFVPGRVIYFNVEGQPSNSNQNGGSVVGGTAEDGTTRNFIYSADSHLATATIHAGLLEIGEKGVIKVTLLDPQPNYIGSSQPIKGRRGKLQLSGDQSIAGESSATGSN